MCQMFLFSLVRNVRKTTNPKIWAGVLEEIPLTLISSKMQFYKSNCRHNYFDKFWRLLSSMTKTEEHANLKISKKECYSYWLFHWVL